jgi:hypothetical protein
VEQTAAFTESEVRAPGKEPIIAPDLQRLDAINVWDLKHHPRNVRKHNLGAIEHGLRRYGQQTPIVVQRSTGFVCKGNGTLRVARDVLGWDRLAVSIEDFDDQTAINYLLDDNRASDLSDYDRPALAALLKEQDEGGHLQSTLWDLDAAETVWDEMNMLTISNPESFKGGYVETPEELAERAASKNADGPAKFREVVLALKYEDYDEFALAVSKLSRAYGTKGVIATVMEAIRRAAAQVVA